MSKLPKGISYTPVNIKSTGTEMALSRVTRNPIRKRITTTFSSQVKSLNIHPSCLDFHDPAPSGFSAAPDFQKPPLPLLTLRDPLQLCLSLQHTPEPTVPPTCSTPPTLCCITHPRPRPPGPPHEMLQTQLVLLPSHWSRSASGAPPHTNLPKDGDLRAMGDFSLALLPTFSDSPCYVKSTIYKLPIYFIVCPILVWAPRTSTNFLSSLTTSLRCLTLSHYISQVTTLF